MRVAGIDCCARFTRIVVCDAATGEVQRRGWAPHPEPRDGALPVDVEADPESWLISLGEAAADGLLEDVDAIGVAGQQHGMVPLDGNGEIIRPALLQQDRRDAGAAAELLAELGGPAGWVAELGTVPEAGWTAAKLRWLARNEPAHAERLEQVLLPHDWINWQLTGRPRRCTTDRGDASGTGYWSPATGRWRADLQELALGHETVLPHVLGPAENAGRTPDGILVSAGTGETSAAAFGLGLRPGDAVVSLAGGGAAFARHDAPLADPAGVVTPLADAQGGFLPVVQTRNASLVLRAAATLLGTDPTGLARLAGRSEPGASGLVLDSYCKDAPGPHLPYEAGTLSGLREGNMRAEHVARAAVEAVLRGLADALDLLRRGGVTVRRVVLLGSAARWPVVREAAPALLGAPVAVAETGVGEYAAIGAARQAAWALHGATAEPPPWTSAADSAREPADAG